MTFKIKFRGGAWELSHYGEYIASFNSRETARAGAMVEIRRRSRKIPTTLSSNCNPLDNMREIETTDPKSDFSEVIQTELWRDGPDDLRQQFIDHMSNKSYNPMRTLQAFCHFAAGYLAGLKFSSTGD